jgi:hypothetical protein
VSGETQWWGPGARNALLLSDNAEGVPHGFVRTARPLRSPVGDVDARWIVGGLTESVFFDTSSTNELRALSGAVATVRVRGEPGLTLGLARLVLAPVSGRGGLARHAPDALARWGAADRASADDSSRARDQLTALFGRWVFPQSGFEVYGEWARSELPRSLRELLAAPQRSQAYTLGAAQAVPLGTRGAVRAQLELTSLEQSRTLTDRPPVDDFYTSRAAPQGFTHRGRVLGAAIGPGGSSQWLAVDAFRGRWQGGLFAERVRRENDALYREYLANAFRHDVTVTGGARAAVRLPLADVRAELAYSDRINYLFQNGTANLGGFRTVDVHNVSLTIHVSPRPAGAGADFIRRP